jgi:tetratricopeptide (TPR) repeat protein
VERTPEVWIDEGPIVDDQLRGEASGAVQRASQSSRPRSRQPGLDPSLAESISESVGPKRAERLIERLGAAGDALERERFDDARRIAAPLARSYPDVAAVHEMIGLAEYRLGHWKKAIAALERSHELDDSVETLPVLADCYRAVGEPKRVEALWEKVKRASPRHEVMAEARIVMAGSLADRGQLGEAIELLAGSSKRPRRVRDHHLRQWYALGDLFDRSGDVVSARRWFTAVAAQDPDFVDVVQRLRSLGR